MVIISSKVWTGNTVSFLAFKVGKNNIDQAEALAVMNTIVASNIFFTPSGALTGVRDVKIIDTTTSDLYDPSQV